jgi:CrcB protein
VKPSELGLVAAGGAIGTVARYSALEAFPVARGTFPTTTFVVNAIAGFLLGLLLARLATNDRYKPFLVPGIVGGFGTLSLVAVETALLIDDGEVMLGVEYLAATVVVGVLVVLLGSWIGRGKSRLVLTSEEMM